MSRKNKGEFRRLEDHMNERPERGISSRKGGFGNLTRKHSERNSTRAEQFLQVRINNQKLRNGKK